MLWSHLDINVTTVTNVTEAMWILDRRKGYKKWIEREPKPGVWNSISKILN